MKNDIKKIEYWDIDCKYIISVLNGCHIEYPDFYRELERLSAAEFAIHLVYDYRQDRQAKRKFRRIKPLRSLSAIGFLNEQNTFHQLDRFSLSLANGKTAVYHQCYADVVMLVMRNQFYALCNVVQPQEKEDSLLFSIAEKYGYSPEDKTAIKELFNKIAPTNPKLTKP